MTENFFYAFPGLQTKNCNSRYNSNLKKLDRIKENLDTRKDSATARTGTPGGDDSLVSDSTSKKKKKQKVRWWMSS